MELRGTTVAVLVGQDFEESEAIYPIYRLREAGAEVIVAAEGGKAVQGKHGYPLEVDVAFEDLAADDLAGVVIPGGYGPDHVRRSRVAVDLVGEVFERGKVVAAVCHGAWVLASAGIVKGKRLTSFPSIKDDLVHAGARWVDEEVVVDGDLVTSREPADLPAFLRAIVERLAAQAAPEPRRRRATASGTAGGGRQKRRPVGAGRR